MATDSPRPLPGSSVRPNRLDSWKAIADYLGRDVRTVIRWEKERHLPVRRVPGGRTRSVFAFEDELNAWLEGEHSAAAIAEATEVVAPASAPPLPTSPSTPVPSPHRRRTFSAGRVWAVLLPLLIIAAVIGVGTWTRGPVRAIARLSVHDSVIDAFDASGAPLWSYALPGRVLQPVDTTTSAIEDIDGDGRPEAVVAVVFAGPGPTYVGRLFVLNADGRLRWERALEDVLTFGDTSYGPPWLPNRLLVYRSADGQPRIAMSAHHSTWWPGIVTSFDGHGAMLGRFVNAGWIYDLRTSADGRYLLAAGVANALGGSVLAVLDAEHIDGVAPTADGAPVCANCPAGAPVKYVLVPWSDLAIPAESPKTLVGVYASGEIELRCLQVFGNHHVTFPEAIIQLSPALDVISRRVSDAFWPSHAEEERRGQITHTAAACPWRGGPPVRTWTPGHPWVSVETAARDK